MVRSTPSRMSTVAIVNGYTLLELLVVLAILGLIVSFAAPRVIGYFERSKTQVANVDVANISAALDVYREKQTATVLSNPDPRKSGA